MTAPDPGARPPAPAHSHSATRRTSGWIPHGVRLDEPAFAARHRMLLAVMLAQVPALGLLAATRHVGDAMVWAQLLAVLVLAWSGRSIRSQAGRSCLVSLGLMICADVLVHIGGGLTDLHIWF